MPLKLIVGPPNSGRAGEVRRRLDGALDREPVLVVPTGDDAAWFERELCDGGRPALGISIRTFGWLFEDVASALALDAGPSLTGPQRLALLRAAISTTELRRLHRSAQRPGFAPALDSLIEELQAALIGARELSEHAEGLDDGAHEQELAELYSAYVALRRRSGRTDRGALADAALAALRANPEAWGDRPVFLYGFDDLTAAQRELVAALARSAEVTVAVNYADRRSLAARATLVSELRDELGGEIDLELVPEDHTRHRSLLHLDRGLFEPGAGTVEPDEGVVLMECAGERGEAEAIGLELARLLAEGVDPGEIAIVVRNPSGSGQVLARVLSGYGIPVALEARAPVDRTGVGRALVALCRAAGPSGTAEDLLAHLRADPSFETAIADRVEERIRRGKARTPGEVIEGWQRAPRHFARLLTADGGAERLHALAAIAREVAEGAHREQAPLAASGASASAAGMLHPLELRAAVAAAELLSELAALGELPGCPEPGLEEAIEAIEGASVRVWRGPTDGRVRILSPYRLRAGRTGYLFCAGLQDGEFPAASPPDPLLGDDRRARLGIAALARREQADEERYLFAACVSRPTERLYLCWRSCDDEGLALSRSPFIDEVLDLLGDSPAEAEAELTRSRGLEQVVPEPGEAPSERELARSLASRGPDADPAAALAAVGVAGAPAERVLAALAAAPEPSRLPGPLAVEAVLEALRERRLLSANQLERWIECPYRWFVDHELNPVRLEPESDPLWLGGVVHKALANLYGEAPGEDAIPRPGDVGRWKARFWELLGEAVGEARLGPGRVAALARAREQVDRFLSDEATSETELRPRPDLLERGFGMDDPDDPGGLDLGDFVLRGRIDRIDLAPGGSAAVIRDYKTGASVTDAAKFEDKGSLQIQLYIRAAQEMLKLEVIGGLYQPLGATNPGKRRPRGLVLKDDERLAGLDLVRGSDHCDREAFDDHIKRAAERAREAGRELQSGDIGRRPLEGRCPKYCTFQPICRLERAIGLPEENGGDGG